MTEAIRDTARDASNRPNRALTLAGAVVGHAAIAAGALLAVAPSSSGPAPAPIVQIAMLAPVEPEPAPQPPPLVSLGAEASSAPAQPTASPPPAAESAAPEADGSGYQISAEPPVGAFADILASADAAVSAPQVETAPSPAPQTVAALASLSRCRDPDGRRRPACFAFGSSRAPAQLLVANGREEARFAFGPEFAGMSLAEARASLGAPIPMSGVMGSPLAVGTDRRMSSISSIRDSLPPSSPDPAFGD